MPSGPGLPGLPVIPYGGKANKDRVSLKVKEWRFKNTEMLHLRKLTLDPGAPGPPGFPASPVAP